MYRKRALLIVLPLALFIFCGCEKISGIFKNNISKNKGKESPVVQGKVIAKVDDMAITLEDLTRYIDAQNKQIDDEIERIKNVDPNVSQEQILAYLAQLGLTKIETAEQKLEFLRTQLIKSRLFYREAQDRGLDRKDDLRAAIEDFKIGVLVNALSNEEAEKIKITSTDIEAFYNQNKEGLREPELKRVREIVTKNQAQANAALVEVLQGTDFAEVAKKYSTSKTASAGGDLGFIGAGAKFQQFDIAVYSLDVGGVSSVIKDPATGEFYIVKVEEEKGGKEKPLSELWDAIKVELEQRKQKEAMDALVDRLWREAKIDIQTSEIK